ncbi:MAG: T9SS type A sorting domain-containing protein [Bacteroidia bacterium]|nr:T9SS type A sorting domain-containing protein [Bacteroidia bacterium]
MKKLLLVAAILGTLPRLFSQTNDSLSMLSGTPLDIYYNLTTGHRDTVRNNNWHIAFGMRRALPPYQTMQAATIRINEGRSVEIYKSNTTISNWSTFDTAGWMGWPSFYNNDSTWDIGAMNQSRNLSNPYDYGWGQYSQSSHNVEGNNIWLIAITTSPNPNDPKTLKRLAVHKIAFDSMWVFTLSNVNGSDSTTITINKAAFAGKMFAYLNVLSKTVIDREPMLNTWDLLFTRYKTQVTMFGQTLMYPVMGVLQNPAVTSVKLEAADARNTAPANTLVFKKNYNQVGWDWKTITTSPGPWPIRDSLAYFIKVGVNKIQRLVFTDYYADGSKQFIKFNKKEFIVTGTETVNKVNPTVTIYPNPAGQQVNITATFNMKVNKLNVRLFDVTGREVINELYDNVNGSFSAKLITASLKSGLYFISLDADGMVASQKLVIE